MELTLLNTSFVKQLSYNGAILVTLAFFYSFILRFKKTLLGKLLCGLLFGTVAILGMMFPLHYAPGIIYDGRSIVLTLAGLFGGLEVAVTSSILAGLYRIFLGGVGVYVGLLTIVMCSVTGVFFRKIKKGKIQDLTIVELYGIGITTHIVMLLCQFFLPKPHAYTIINKIWLPVLAVFPVGTMLTGLLLRNEEQRISIQNSLYENLKILYKTQEIGNLGSWVYDIKKDKLTWSNQVYKIFGVKEDAFVPTYNNFLSLVHPLDREIVHEKCQESIRNGLDGFEIEHRIVVPEKNEIKIVFEKCEHIKDQKGNILRSIGFIQDITEQKRIQEELRVSEERFRLTFYHFPDAVNINKLHNGEYIDVNESFCRATGYKREEVIGKSSLEINIWANPEDRDDLVEKLKQNGEVLNQEYRFRKKNGEIIIGLLSAAIIEINNEPCILNITKDITEKKKIEQELKDLTNQLEDIVKQRTKELEEANRELKDFAYSVSHDLKAPLRAIKGFSQIISSRYKDELNHKALHYFENILEACEHMENLIEDLLLYSKVTKEDVVYEEISLFDLTTEIVNSLKSNELDLNIEIKIDENLPKIVGNKTLVRQVFYNLIDNAIKYRKDDINHIVEIKRGDMSNSHIIIEVADNGLGIAPEYHEKIFDIFQRLHPQDKYPGTGIGLALVKKALNKMNMSIEVESSLGKGSIFKVKIPKDMCIFT